MPVSLAASELINIAISIEKTGVAFYDIMSRSTKNATAREVFQHLVDMEREHIQIFQGMLSEADKYQSSATRSGKHATYIQALVDNAVFTDDMIISEMAMQATNDIKALELGISAEKDSILFYHEMTEVMPQQAYPALNKIIAEEKVHLKQLSELKKKLTAT